MKATIPNCTITDQEIVNKEFEKSELKLFPASSSLLPIIKSDPLPYEPAFEWQFVTRELEEVRRKSEENWTIFGEVMHQLFEEIANEHLVFRTEYLSQILTRAEHLLLASGMTKTDLPIWLERIQDQFKFLETKGLLSIILPQPNSYAELPFILKKGKIIYSGRIDRIIKTSEEIKIYDYKTFPLQDEELKPFISKYAQQLAIYREAVTSIFDFKNVSTYLLFTSRGELIKT